MSILSYLQEAQIRDDIQSLEGEILTRPALLKTDGTLITWACDVKLPGYDEPLRVVPIAMNNRDLVYACEVGQAVSLARSKTGRFEVTGLSKRKPGTRRTIAVDLSSGVAQNPTDVTLQSRVLNYGELMQFGGYGLVPYGATALFRGGVLVSVQ